MNEMTYLCTNEYIILFTNKAEKLFKMKKNVINREIERDDCVLFIY